MTWICCDPSSPRSFAHRAPSSILSPWHEHGAWHRVGLSGFLLKEEMNGWVNKGIHHLYPADLCGQRLLLYLSSALRKSLWIQTPPLTAWRIWAHPPTTQPGFRHWMGPWGARQSRPPSPRVRGSGVSRALRSLCETEPTLHFSSDRDFKCFYHILIRIINKISSDTPFILNMRVCLEMVNWNCKNKKIKKYVIHLKGIHQRC